MTSSGIMGGGAGESERKFYQPVADWRGTWPTSDLLRTERSAQKNQCVRDVLRGQRETTTESLSQSCFSRLLI